MGNEHRCFIPIVDSQNDIILFNLGSNAIASHSYSFIEGEELIHVLNSLTAGRIKGSRLYFWH